MNDNDSVTDLEEYLLHSNPHSQILWSEILDTTLKRNRFNLRHTKHSFISNACGWSPCGRGTQSYSRLPSVTLGPEPRHQPCCPGSAMHAASMGISASDQCMAEVSTLHSHSITLVFPLQHPSYIFKSNLCLVWYLRPFCFVWVIIIGTILVHSLHSFIQIKKS